MVNFIRNHPFWAVGTVGLAVVGYLGYRAVSWILEKTGLIKRADDVAQMSLPRTIDVPGDGNCLFHSFIVAHNLKIDHMTLRNQVVDFLQANAKDEELLFYIREAFNQEKEDKIKALTEELLALRHSDEPAAKEIAKNVRGELRRLRNRPFDIHTYLRLMRRNGTFAGEPELYALSKLYPVRLRIFPGNSPRPIIFEFSDSPRLPVLSVRLRNLHYTVEVY